VVEFFRLATVWFLHVPRCGAVPLSHITRLYEMQPAQLAIEIDEAVTWALLTAEESLALRAAWLNHPAHKES
jgi:hypothetical protein